MTRLFFSIFVVIAAAGCDSCNTPPNGGEGEGEGEGGGNPADAAQLCEVWTRGEGSFTVAVLAGFATPERCVAADTPPLDPTQLTAAAHASCADPTDPVRHLFDVALAGHSVTFHLDAINACSAIDQSDPNTATNPTLPATCAASALFTSNLSPGDVCVQDWDCPDGTACEADQLTTQTLKCLAPAVAGDPCAAGGLALSPDSPNAPRNCDASTECVGNVCVAKPGQGGDCSNGETCADGFFCDQGQNPAKCATKIATGSAGCTAAGDCVDSNATCTPAQKCALPIDDGAACVAGTDVCKNTCSTCRPTTAGGTTTQCQDRGVAGAACTTTDDCSHGFVCDDTTTHTCVLGGAAGATCASSADCKDGFVCNDDGTTCVAEPNLGDTCGPTTTSTCKTGQCNGTHCVAGNTGDTCDTDSVCVNGGLCRVSDHTCQAAPTTGACSTDGACDVTAICDDATTTCKPIPAVGGDCITSAQQPTCDVGQFCDTTNKCQVLKDAGSTCSTDPNAPAECKGSCVNGTCSAVGASCGTTKGFFPIFVILSVCLPVSRRLRRAIRERRAA